MKKYNKSTHTNHRVRLRNTKCERLQNISLTLAKQHSASQLRYKRHGEIHGMLSSELDKKGNRSYDSKPVLLLLLTIIALPSVGLIWSKKASKQNRAIMEYQGIILFIELNPKSRNSTEECIWVSQRQPRVRNGKLINLKSNITTLIQTYSNLSLNTLIRRRLSTQLSI